MDSIILKSALVRQIAGLLTLTDIDMVEIACDLLTRYQDGKPCVFHRAGKMIAVSPKLVIQLAHSISDKHAQTH